MASPAGYWLSLLVAIAAISLSFCGKPKLVDWPLRAFAAALLLSTFGAIL